MCGVVLTQHEDLLNNFDADLEKLRQIELHPVRDLSLPFQRLVQQHPHVERNLDSHVIKKEGRAARCLPKTAID
jgi:hypothetical protein